MPPLLPALPTLFVGAVAPLAVYVVLPVALSALPLAEFPPAPPAVGDPPTPKVPERAMKVPKDEIDPTSPELPVPAAVSAAPPVPPAPTTTVTVDPKADAVRKSSARPPAPPPPPPAACVVTLALIQPPPPPPPPPNKMTSTNLAPAGFTQDVVPMVVKTWTSTSCGISSAACAINTTAEPERFKSDPVLDELRVRDSVVPDVVYVPVPISQAVPSSIAYRTTLPFATPAAAKLWYPVVGEPSVIVPVPVVAVETRARFPYFGIIAPSKERSYTDSAFAPSATSAGRRARIKLAVGTAAAATGREATRPSTADDRCCCGDTSTAATRSSEV